MPGLSPESYARPLCREARRIWLARAEIHRRARRLTALHVEIARAMLRRLGFDGRLDPSHARIGADAGCSARTVQRALARLAGLGLLTWQHRSRPGGGQTSNGYAFCPDAAAPLPPRKPVGQVGGRITDTRIKSPVRSVAAQIAAGLAWAREASQQASLPARTPCS